MDEDKIQQFEEPPLVSIPDILASGNLAKHISVEGKILKVNLLRIKQCSNIALFFPFSVCVISCIIVGIHVILQLGEVFEKPHYKLKKVVLGDKEGRKLEVKLWGKRTELQLEVDDIGVFTAVETDSTGASSTAVTCWKVSKSLL